MLPTAAPLLKIKTHPAMQCPHLARNRYEQVAESVSDIDSETTEYQLPNREQSSSDEKVYTASVENTHTVESRRQSEVPGSQHAQTVRGTEQSCVQYFVSGYHGHSLHSPRQGSAL